MRIVRNKLGNPQNLTNAGKGRPPGSKNVYSIDNLKRAVARVEKKYRISYLAEMVEKSRDDPALARIIMDRLLPIPKDTTQPTTIVINNYIPGLTAEIKNG